MKRKMLTYNFLICISIIIVLTIQLNFAYAQVDTIRLKDHRLNTATLKPGMRQYLVYYQFDKRQKSIGFWLWLRDTKIKSRNGEQVFVTTQHWYGSDTTSHRVVYSINRKSDFSPIYHAESIGGKNRAYNWYEDRIKGTDTVPDNSQKNFLLNFLSPNFNWNLDIETFQMLPLAAGKTFAINFYDAGLEKPEYVVYKVIGSEVISMEDEHKVDCWKLLNESVHDGQHATETYWISKKQHEFIKEEDSFPGGYRYKIRLPTAAYNLLDRSSK